MVIADQDQGVFAFHPVLAQGHQLLSDLCNPPKEALAEPVESWAPLALTNLPALFSTTPGTGDLSGLILGAQSHQPGVAQQGISASPLTAGGRLLQHSSISDICKAFWTQGSDTVHGKILSAAATSLSTANLEATEANLIC